MAIFSGIFGNKKNEAKTESETGWYFPSGRNLEKTSASNAYVETFKDNPLTSLSREITQNSLDAIADNDKPVKLVFSLFEIESKDLPGFEEFKEKIIPKAQESWKKDTKTQDLLRNMLKTLNSQRIKVLKISDYNTTGLLKENWESLIEQVGSSVKKDEDAGGSFGIGKAAPFAVSNLRMVFYNTRTLQDDRQSIGVTKFVSFDTSDNEITQGAGYYGEKEKTPFNHDISFDDIERNENGTDVYIMGFDAENYDDWEKDVIFDLLDNFLLSIFNEALEVEVSKIKINKESIKQYIEEIVSNDKLTKKYTDLLSYYKVLNDENNLKIKLPQIKECGIEYGEAILFLSDLKDGNRKVLMSRKSGMKIFSKNKISGLIKFSGVFQATGKNLNTCLRTLENPNHDKWSVDRGRDKKEAKVLLDSIYRFIKDAVIENFQEKNIEEVDAFGVSDFLPADLSDIKKKNQDTIQDTTGYIISPKLVEKKKLNRNSLPIRSEETGEMTELELIEAGIIKGDLGGYAPNGNIAGNKINSNNDAGLGEEEGSNGVSNEDNKIKVLEKISRKKVNEITYRFPVKDTSKGIYQFVYKSAMDLNKIKISIFVVGDSGNKEKLNLKVVYDKNGQKIQTKGNTFYLSNSKGNQWERVYLTINNKQRLKLEAEVYANN